MSVTTEILMQIWSFSYRRYRSKQKWVFLHWNTVYNVTCRLFNLQQM